MFCQVFNRTIWLPWTQQNQIIFSPLKPRHPPQTAWSTALRPHRKQPHHVRSDLSDQSSTKVDLSSFSCLPVSSQPARSCTTNTSPVTHPLREAHVPNLNHTQMIWENVLTYSTDGAKISYLEGLLRGNAIWDSQTALSASNSSFIAELGTVFDPPVQRKQAARRLHSLHQCSLSVAEYSFNFRIIDAESSWLWWGSPWGVSYWTQWSC